MRRVILGLAGAAGVAAAAASVPLLSAPLEGADARMVAGLEAATGLTVRANGESVVQLFPSPRVRVEGVSLAHGDEAPFAVARSLVGRVSLSALLRGRLELAEAILEEPQVALDRMPFEDMTAALRARGGTPPSIRLVDGRLSWGDRTVDKVEGGLAFSRDGGPLTLSGYGRLAGKQVEATVQLADLAAFSRREEAPFRARFEGGGARVLFDGDASDAGGLKLVGDISVRAETLSGALRWLGAGPRLGRALGAEISFAGRGQLDAGGLQISNAELDFAGETFLGAGRLTPGAEGLAVEATLDAGSVDLAPYLDLVAPQALRSDGVWSAEPVALANLRGWTLDLRLSADVVRFGGLRLDQPAITAIVAKGGLDLSIGEASAYGGAVGGRLALEPDGDAARMRLEGAVSEVALGEALDDVVGRRPITGALTGEILLESRGSSTDELVRGLKGSIGARLADGALERVSRSRTLALAGLSGRMEFTNARAEMAVENGLARAEPVVVEGPRANFSLSGQASLIERTVALSGFVRPVEGGWTLPVRIDGPLFAPKLRPDLSGPTPRGEARRQKP